MMNLKYRFPIVLNWATGSLPGTHERLALNCTVYLLSSYDAFHFNFLYLFIHLQTINYRVIFFVSFAFAYLLVIFN